MKRELTAKEEQDILDRDPKYQALMAEKRRQWAIQAEMLRRDEKPLVEALIAAGWPASVPKGGEVRSVWDLVNTAEPYTHLLDTLADHLPRPYHACIREGIARALAVREARGTRVPRIVMDELKKQTDPKDEAERSYRWSLINTLVLVGDSSMTDEVRQLMEDQRYARARKDLQRLAKALNRPSRRRDEGR
jgi:hypothetical protein